MRVERAYAKINLYLDVVSRRENGYHNLVSIMQTVSLCDLVTVNYSPETETNIILTASGNDAMPLDRKNLAWRAAELFLEAVGMTGRVAINIEKRIPMAAGLAGGSTDAAAVLRGLNTLCKSPLSPAALCELGAKLGADVPFCIMGGMAMVTGIGENLEPLPSMPDCPMVVACMGEGVSTIWAYGKLDEKYDSFSTPKECSEAPSKIVSCLAAKDFSGAGEQFFNLFEEVVPAVQPCVEPIKAEMMRQGAIRSMMSGSGPSVFGVFEDVKKAESACEALRQMGAAAFVCNPTKQYEL